MANKITITIEDGKDVEVNTNCDCQHGADTTEQGGEEGKVAQLGEIAKDGDWLVKKQEDGFFEAWYTKKDISINVSTPKGQVFESERKILAFPSTIIPKNYDELLVDLDVSSRLFGAWGALYEVSENGIDYSAFSAVSRGVQTCYRLTAYVAGFFKLKG